MTKTMLILLCDMVANGITLCGLLRNFRIWSCPTGHSKMLCAPLCGKASAALALLNK